MDECFPQPLVNIALYGPPGAGKSTIISFAKRAGWSALDLEEVGTTFEERKAFMLERAQESALWTLFGAADIPPERFPKGTRFVLLAPEEEILVSRVQQRNDTRTHKWIEHAKKVRAEHLQMAEEGVFDLVITEDLSPQKTLEKIATNLSG